MCNPKGQTRVWFMYCFGPKKEHYILPNKILEIGCSLQGKNWVEKRGAAELFKTDFEVSGYRMER